MKKETITAILCEGKIVGQHAKHEIFPVQIEFPQKAGPTNAFAHLLKLSPPNLGRYEGVEVHGKKYVLYFDKADSLSHHVIATYPLRTCDGEIFHIVAGSVIVAKEDENRHALDISKAEQTLIAEYLDEQVVLAGLSVLFGKDC